MGAVYGAIGRFNILNQRGQSRYSGAGVPIKELPLTRGGIAANDKCFFGRIAWADPAKPGLLYGSDNATTPIANGIPLGIFAMSLARMVRNPVRNNRYLQNEACDLFVYGELQYRDYDSALKVKDTVLITSQTPVSPTFSAGKFSDPNSPTEPVKITIGTPTDYKAVVYSIGEGALNEMIQIWVDFTGV